MLLRVLSYNIRSLRDDSSAAAAIVRGSAADVVLVQEAPRFFRWRAKVTAFAGECGMVPVVGGRGAAAMLVMATREISVMDTREVLFPKSPGLHRRGIALAILEKSGFRFGVGSFHLGGDERERIEHAGLVVRSFLSMDPGVDWVLGGDLNEVEGGPAWSVIAEGRLDVWRAASEPLLELTNDATNPKRRIDAVFCDQNFTVIRGGVPPGLDELMRRGSDHRPVLAELLGGVAGR